MNIIHDFYCTACSKRKPLAQFYVGSAPNRARCITCEGNRREHLKNRAAGTEPPKPKNPNNNAHYRNPNTLKFFQMLS